MLTETRVVERKRPYLHDVLKTIVAVVPCLLGVQIFREYGLGAIVAFAALLVVALFGGAYSVQSRRKHARRRLFLASPLRYVAALRGAERVRVRGVLKTRQPVEVPLLGLHAAFYRGEVRVAVGEMGTYSEVASVVMDAAACRLMDETGEVSLDLSGGVEGLSPHDLEVFHTECLAGDPLKLNLPEPYRVRIEYLVPNVSLTVLAFARAHRGKCWLTGPVVVRRHGRRRRVSTKKVRESGSVSV